MNELESYLTQRASDFPLLAQFLYPQPDPSLPPADAPIDILAAALGDVVASSSPLFVDLARRTLNDLCRLRASVNLSNIIHHVELEFRLQPGTLQSRSKTQRVALARHVAYFLCRTMTGSSFPAIGEAVGGRHHSSVLHGFSLIQSRCHRDAPFRFFIDRVRNDITRVGDDHHQEKTPPQPEREVLTVEELAAWLRLAPSTIYRHAKTGRLPRLPGPQEMALLHVGNQRLDAARGGAGRE